jgi:Domain of unknown function (DUF4342)
MLKVLERIGIRPCSRRAITGEALNQRRIQAISRKNSKENHMTPNTQEFKLSGDSVLSKIKELVHEGNVHRVTIKNDDGHTLIEIPLTIGVVGALLLPVWAAIGAIAALAASLTIVVERTDVPPVEKPNSPSLGSPDSA